MVRTTGKLVRGDERTSPPASAEYEAMLGRIVIEMLRAGKPVNRTSLCAKIAFLMDKSQHPPQEIVYEKLLRFLLNTDH